MRKLLSVGFIGVYLGALGLGLVSHMLGAWNTAHPVMYYIVWDMFCGWSAYDSRIHVIAEGESQTYYRLTPTPWGELHPYGSLGREHYDVFNNHAGQIGLNVLRHTQHEPISRIFVIEEAWAKKYNLQQPVWESRYDDPKDKLSYFRVRAIMLPDSQVTERYDSWMAHQAGRMFADNPRLQADSKLNQPVFVRETPRQPVGRPFGSQSHLRFLGTSSPSAN